MRRRKFRVVSGESIETGAELRERIAHGFCRRADADPKVIRATKKTARNHGSIKARAKQLTKLIDIAATQSRKSDCSVFGPKRIEIVAGI